ncbi:hypothetical protein GALMADRAFT_228909 [Galerina marginata CBS 339.88]|uniref:Uncharacterized protein n=1 Tax=Galerina marginata (strain CBS 339.88) TaxID=685588 RepID=A0A067SRG6_GALM3|nr:hypothetical protein GALMADRAFT_228909 [Galerina marginata CBS 339.88]
MNTNNNSTTTSGNASSGFGTKIKGAVEAVHGAGENIRGTMLGAVDTMSKKGPTKNDEIAREGRLEMERGLAKLRGTNVTSQAGTGPTGATTGMASSYPEPSANANVNANQLQTDQFHGGGAAHGTGLTGAKTGTAPSFPEPSANTGANQLQTDQFQGGNATHGTGLTGATAAAASSYPEHSSNANANQFQTDQYQGGNRTHGTGPTGATAATASSYEPSSNANQFQTDQFQSGGAPHGTGPTNTAAMSGPGYTDDFKQPHGHTTGGPADTYPSHHRDDAIAGVPPAQLQEVRAVNQDYHLAQNSRSEYDPSQATYRGQTTAKEPVDTVSNDQRTGMPDSGYNNTSGPNTTHPNVDPVN